MHVYNPDNLPDAELGNYVARAEAMKARGELPEDCDSISVSLRGDEVDIRYFRHAPARGFERIRRITGYLVGTLERFNDAKKAEEHDRVKHGIATSAAGAE